MDGGRLEKTHMGSCNIIIDGATDSCELNRGQLGNSTDLNFMCLLVDLFLGPDKLV